MVIVSPGAPPSFIRTDPAMGKDQEYTNVIKNSFSGGRVAQSGSEMGGGKDINVDVSGTLCDLKPQHHHHQDFAGSGLQGLNRSKSLYSLSTSSASSADSSAGKTTTSLASICETSHGNENFGADLRACTGGSRDVPVMDKRLRETMEPYLMNGRMLREKARNRTCLDEVHSSIASSMGVPYTKLRSERPFLFDVCTHPMHEVLAETLGVSDLSKLHHQSGDLAKLLSPLLSREARRKFQEAFDIFVTSFCIPLLHSLAMSKSIFHNQSSGSSNFVSYRYQAFPTLQIARPGDSCSSQSPRCDSADGHSIGCLQFHVPLTPTFGTNCLYTESHPGKEDWHPLTAKSVGLGYLFDGARCLHYRMENTTDATSVTLSFRIAIYQEGDDDEIDRVGGSSLCSREILEDSFSRAGPGYYDEAAIDLGLGSPSWQIVAKKYGSHLMDPDYRVGFPFV